MRFSSLLSLILVLGVVMSVVAQPSPSNSESNSNSHSNSVSVTNSGTVSRSGSTSGSVSGTNSNTKSNSNSWTSSETASPTTPTPDAPVNLVNHCPKKIIHACISWDEPATATFVSYIVNYRLAGTTGAPTQIATTGTFQKVSGLTPQTSYEFWIVGITAAGISSFDSSFLTVLTQESDAKLDPAKDITNVVCDWFNDRTPGVFPRREIRCSWTAAAPVQPKRIKAKVHCTSAIREPLFIRKSLYGADATATEVVFHTHRDVATCFIYLRAYYPKRPATRHVSVIIVGDDDS